MLLYHELPYIEPRNFFKLVADLAGTIWLSSEMPHLHYGRYSFILINPLKIYSGNQVGAAIIAWKELFAHNVQEYHADLPPFTGGIAGYFSYDLIQELEPSVNIPIMDDVARYHFGLYNQVIAFDYYKQKCYLMVAKVNNYICDYTVQLQNLVDLYRRAANSINMVNYSKSIKSYPLKLNLTSNFTESQYIKAAKLAVEYITNGDIFEVNLAQCYTAELDSRYHYSCEKLFTRLMVNNPSPFAAYLNLGDTVILSASPERFLSIRQRVVESRPIKGTIKRSQDRKCDDQLKQKLLNSDKDQAENIMIVDLMRSDLSKICIPSSINVPQLCCVESFTNLHHLVSVVTGVLRPDKSIFDAILATFPGGSITGAPKIRAIQIIAELEQQPRGVYCGSIGYLGFNGNIDLSIAIRTIIKNKNSLSFSVGGAITLASDPLAEYQESLLKGQKLMETLIDSSY